MNKKPTLPIVLKRRRFGCEMVKRLYGLRARIVMRELLLRAAYKMAPSEIFDLEMTRYINQLHLNHD